MGEGNPLRPFPSRTPTRPGAWTRLTQKRRPRHDAEGGDVTLNLADSVMFAELKH